MNRTEVITRYVSQFRAAFKEGVDGIVKAAGIYVRALDDNPRNADLFHKEFKNQISEATWSQLEALGRKWIHPKLMLTPFDEPRRADIIRGLSYSLQERVMNREKFDFMTREGESRKIDLLEAPIRAVEQVCAKTSVRNVEEQKAWLEAIDARNAQYAEQPAYMVIGNKVYFKRGCVLSGAEMQKILEQIK
jgi:hypothetical protein